MLHALFIDVFNDRDVKRTSTTLFFKMLQTIFFDFVSILLSCCNETADVAMLHTMNDVAAGGELPGDEFFLFVFFCA